MHEEVDMSEAAPVDPYTSPAAAPDVGDHTSETTRLVGKVVKYVGLTSFLLVLLIAFNVVSITYDIRIENEPLSNPVRVLKRTTDEIHLADGRVITDYFGHSERLDWSLKHVGPMIEVQPSAYSPNSVTIFANESNFICRSCVPDPWAQIPLIPIRVNRYKRVQVGDGILQKQD